MTRKQRFQKIIEYFQEHNPDADTELNYTDPFQLVVAVILSAQCTDKRVNIITKELFRKYPTAEKMAEAAIEEIFSYIKSCSYPNNKSRYLSEMSKVLIREYKGIVPDDIEELQKIPGIGRKTANVIASVIYNKPALAVDTHVFRVSERIGLSENAKTPYQTEMQLLKYIPRILLPRAHHWLILHGRYVCKARKPECFRCGIVAFCAYGKKNLT